MRASTLGSEANTAQGSSQISNPPQGAAPQHRLVFTAKDEFYGELRRRVEDFLQRAELPARGSPWMYAKAGIFLGAFGGLYVALVFLAAGWFSGLLLAMGLGAAAAAIGLNIMHDGGHGSFSKHAWINKLAALTLELVGGSSYIWHWKHGVYHHTYTNVAGHDSDIDVGFLGRFSPHQPHYWHQRWQHWYLWFLYGLMAIQWHVYDDFHDLIRGKIGDRPFPRPAGRDLVTFICGKIVFFSLAFGLPALFHPIWVVACYYAATSIVLGILLSVIFQIAHCVEGSHFVKPVPGSNRLPLPWAVHQVESTCNFLRKGRVGSWLLGGLNYQIEHHLFPKISHVHYRRITRLVEDTCREFGVKYSEHRTLLAGIVSHYRWLERMGMALPKGVPSAAAAAE